MLGVRNGIGVGASLLPTPTVPRVHGQEVHAAGGWIVPQLWHAGLERKGEDVPDPAVAAVGPADLTKPQIAEIVDAFARSAADARRLGFDGLAPHGGHGYLIDQFLRAATNPRTDAYGGDPARRTRFAAEVVAACRAAVGPGFPIFLRISHSTVTDFDARLAPPPPRNCSSFWSRWYTPASTSWTAPPGGSGCPASPTPVQA
ncbi:hypothetical protein AB0945_37010 [Streptomyces sp. NPDC005474]|uniref:oxidoreductase n=1 Tax=Streptomyces sp. NPDC005474 TaxID=3154878 RepID=UPI0034565041